MRKKSKKIKEMIIACGFTLLLRRRRLWQTTVSHNCHSFLMTTTPFGFIPTPLLPWPNLLPIRFLNSHLFRPRKIIVSGCILNHWQERARQKMSPIIRLNIKISTRTLQKPDSTSWILWWRRRPRSLMAAIFGWQVVLLIKHRPCYTQGYLSAMRSTKWGKLAESWHKFRIVGLNGWIVKTI